MGILVDIIWAIRAGTPMAVATSPWGAIGRIAIAGIPFGTQVPKIAELSFLPFGAGIP